MSSYQLSYTMLNERSLAIICLAARVGKRTETGSKEYFPGADQSRVFEFFYSKFVRPLDSVWRQIPRQKRQDLLEEYYPDVDNVHSYLSQRGFMSVLKKLCSHWFEDIEKYMPDVLFLMPEQFKVAPTKNSSKNNKPAPTHLLEAPAKHSTRNTPPPKDAEPKSLLSTKRKREGAGEHEDKPRVAKRTRLVTPKSTSGSESPSPSPSPSLQKQQQRQREERWLSEKEVARVGRRPQGNQWKSHITPLRI
ncbi:hypothetical protein HER10_EVM0001902 [Colletotrichum scovillei]|uniref:Uncharacterized protein n=1 Tax=Colletotrichum scovillei TaxID=1209932 RepID=A0A9P7QYK7_9PEZI|nr:uncharacterized protein HER10_EVM0001902 [Colletotrichum scovillei]KAF4774638.1 hypothetical protein HER10_EVM0001902 [Colletotrichum scovillei]KAG7042792.1 hypothetical protein JMJ78_0006299 [Colletotrichum scovillei]KAG7043386.1 hypothetical protein JMJ77_0003092 [Colletotrichum scovillei]KAG7062834.1 hypothetical protein JMJ76_0009677 [Colletotrichum scovillei]